MKKRFFKAGITLCLALGLMTFTACGKKEADTGESYIYNATVETVSLDIEKSDNEYADSRFLAYKEGKIYYLETRYDESYNAKNVLLCVKTVSDSSLTKTELESFMENPGYASYTFLTNDTVSIFMENYTEEGDSNKYIVSYDMQGKFLKKVELDDLMSKESIDYFYNVCMGKNGEYYLATDSCVVVIDGEGKVLAKVSGAQWINTVYSINDDVYASGYFNDDSNFKKIDMDKKTFVDVSVGQIGDNCNWYEYSGNRVFLSNESKVSIRNLDNGEDEALWSWIDLDYSNVSPESIWQNEDGTYGFVLYTYSEDAGDYVIEIAKVKRELETAENAKIKLVYGCTYLDDEVRKAIIRFNKSNDKYKIIVKDYAEEYGYDTASEMMYADISKGGVLDIVTMDNLDNSLVAKKTFVDIAPLIEKDDSIDKADLFTNVIDAGKIDGKLYFAAPRFYINTLIANSDYVGSGEGWTVEDFTKLREKYPDKEFISYAASDQILAYLLVFAGNEYVDYGKSTCSFTGESFKNVLKVAATFKDTFEYSEDYDEWKMIQDEDIIVSNLYLYDYESVVVYQKLFNDKGNVIGYPCQDGKGHSVTFSSYTSILSNSKKQDGAWEFVKTFYSDEASMANYYSGFSVKRSIFEQKAKEAIENGGGGGWSNGNTTVEYTGATKEVVDFIRSIIESANKMTTFDAKINEMIAEEAEPYFKGQKTVDEVCDIIQSRVSIYLAETK